MPRPRPSSAPRWATAVLAPVLALVLVVGGCSGDDEAAPDAPGETATAAAGPPPLRTDAALGVVSGRWDRRTSPRLTKRVALVFDDWVDAAYVGGDYPRSDFVGAYPHFTRGARRDATRDAALMSNAALAPRLTGVRATRRTLRVDVLAAKRRAVGVTARFVLVMTLKGDLKKAERRQRVAGSLFLTFRGGKWTVFGYDVNRGKA